MILCTVSHCGLPSETGDLLFCKSHRELWRAYCKSNGIETIALSKAEIDPYLKEFKQFELNNIQNKEADKIGNTKTRL